MHARRSRVNDTLGNTLVIEMRNFLAEDKILEKCRAARIGLERILIIGERDTLVCSERRVCSASDLMHFAAGGHL